MYFIFILIYHDINVKYIMNADPSALYMQALIAPAALIAQNAGIEGEVVVEKIKSGEWEVG